MTILGIGYIALGMFVAGKVIIEPRWREGGDNVFFYLLLISMSSLAVGVACLFA